VVTDIIDRLANADVESAFSSGLSTHIAPSVYHKKEEIISEADKLLDSFRVSIASLLVGHLLTCHSHLPRATLRR
jgi:hypothetical protein